LLSVGKLTLTDKPKIFPKLKILSKLIVFQGLTINFDSIAGFQRLNGKDGFPSFGFTFLRFFRLALPARFDLWRFDFV
jgi:hypothetical protein